MLSRFFRVPRLKGCFYSLKRTTKTAVVGLVETGEISPKPPVTARF